MLTIGVRRRLPGATKDSHGNAVDTYDDPSPWTVRGMAPGAFNEDGSQNRDRLEVVWTVYADKSYDTPTAVDRVVIGEDTFEVNGEPQDWTYGPWTNPSAGVVVELKRSEG